MSNALEVSDAIRQLCRERKISTSELLFQAGLGVNALRQMVAKNDISVFRLVKIADVLDCSLDCLLKRNNEPGIHFAEAKQDFSVQEAYDTAPDSVKEAVRALLEL